MKKTIILYLIIFLSITIGFSQSLTIHLTEDGEPLFNGEEITISSESVELEIECYLYVRNNMDHAIDVKARKIEVDILENTSNHFCWGDACLPPTQYESPAAWTIESGATTETGDFEGHYNPTGKSGTSKIMYVFFDDNNPEDSIGVLVNYVAGETGLDEYILNNIQFSAPYPNPASDVVHFDYSFPTEIKTARLIIYNIEGLKVKELPINSYSGSLNICITDLQQDFYLYSLLTDRFIIKSGKLLVL